MIIEPVVNPTLFSVHLPVLCPLADARLRFNNNVDVGVVFYYTTTGASRIELFFLVCYAATVDPLILEGWMEAISPALLCRRHPCR